MNLKLLSLIILHVIMSMSPLLAADMGEVFLDKKQASEVISSFIESARTQDFGVASSGRNNRTLIRYSDNLDFSELGIPDIKYLTIQNLPNTRNYPHKDLVLSIHNIIRANDTWHIKATYYTFHQNSLSSPNANFKVTLIDGKFTTALGIVLD